MNKFFLFHQGDLALFYYFFLFYDVEQATRSNAVSLQRQMDCLYVQDIGARGHNVYSYIKIQDNCHANTLNNVTTYNTDGHKSSVISSIE